MQSAPNKGSRNPCQKQWDTNTADPRFADTLDTEWQMTPAKRRYDISAGSVNRPLFHNKSDSTPFLCIDDGQGYLSTENPGAKVRSIPNSTINECRSEKTTFSGNNYGDTDGTFKSTSNSRSFTSSTNNETLKSASTSDESLTSRKHVRKNGPLTRVDKNQYSARNNTQAHKSLTPFSRETPCFNKQSQSFRAPFSCETPCFNMETPIILATARQTGSVISTSCNADSIRQLQNPSFHNSVISSAYFSKKTPSTTTRTTSATSRSGTPGSSSSAMRNSSSHNDDDITSNDVGSIHRTCTVGNLTGDESQVYLGVMWHGGKVGVAYYDLDSTRAYIMLDTTETDDFKLLLRVIHQVNPTQIILSSKQDERLLKVLRNYVSDVTNNPDITDTQDNILQFLPSIDFSIEICKRRVLYMDLPSIPDHYMETERTLYLSSVVPFENVCMVRALGGLLKYLEKMRVGIELEEPGTKLPILDVKIFSLETQMIVDDTAFSALQIFQRESHPSVYKAGTSNSGKEGLSLFGIMNRTKSQIGSKMLRTWFQRPLKDLELIKQRHEAIAYFNNPRNVELVQTLEESVKHVKNISKTLMRMRQSQASVGDWQALYKTVYNATCIKEVCRIQPQTISIFKKVSEKLSDDLHKVTNFINKIVDFPESTLQGRFVVKPNVDAKLDKKKRVFSGLPDFMTKVAHEELNKLGDEVTECSVLYMPQIGYLLAIPETAIRSDPGNMEPHQIQGLEFVFASNNMLNYRSVGTRELDSLLGDTRCDITDMETAIMHKLQNIILEHTDILMVVLELTAELDCLLCLATCAREYNYTRPTMTQDNVIEVVGGRHPIQEVCCSTFVPNDIQSNDDYGHIKVLTGPNACGKSVYLKQVALIVYLAQIGSFVPAEEAILGLIDRIYTRVRSMESVSVGLSTFMIDINQMAEALRDAGERSLCVIDEFGKGTDMTDGVALLCACLSYWVNKSSCPHVFVSTHFHSIIHQHLLPRSPHIKYMTLETLHNGQELIFLYQLTEGHTNSSYACHVAGQAGLPQEIIKRGIEVSALIRQNKPIQRVDTVGTEIQQKRCTTVVNKFLELDLESTDVKTFLSDFVLPTMDGNI